MTRPARLPGSSRPVEAFGFSNWAATNPMGTAAHQQPGVPSVSHASKDDEVIGLSARNRLRGFIDEVRIDGLLAQVRLGVGDQRLTAVITADAVKSLKLRRGDDALAIIKSA